MGQAFAGAAVVQNQVLLFHRVGNEEVLESLDAKTGAPTWRYAYPTNYRDDFGFDEGPRAVPVVANGIVRSVPKGSSTPSTSPRARACGRGHNEALQRGEGLLRRGSSPLVEAVASSPTSAATKPACGVRGEDGKVVWTATDDDASYSSGMAATIGGRRSAIFLTRDNLIGLDPATERSSSSGAGALASRR